jgi:hypothetical protein
MDLIFSPQEAECKYENALGLSLRTLVESEEAAETAKTIAFAKSRSDAEAALALSNENAADALHQYSINLQVCAGSLRLQCFSLNLTSFSF